MTEKDQSLKCTECRMPIWVEKPVWFMGGNSYHPECVKDNPVLLKQWQTGIKQIGQLETKKE